MSRIIIVGAGAAGLMASVFAGRAGAEVILLDHNEKAGKKLYITGKGRCNCTNDCTPEDFMREVPRNARFLYSALSFFGPRDLMNLLESAGCPVEVQRGRRVFPSSEKASDVIRALTGLARDAGVRLLLDREVTGVLVENGHAVGVSLTDGSSLTGNAVLLATGGLSYPSTGSTGDGFRFAAALGHTVFPPVASLSALETKEDWPRILQGLSLRNVRLTLLEGKKKLYSELGEMLFTHFGVSGPLVLEASCHLPEKADQASLLLDLKPGLSPEQLDARLLRELASAGRKQLRTVLPSLLPASLASLFPTLCGLPEDLPCAQLSAAGRQQLGRTLKALPITIRSRRPLTEAIVTRGGVSVREVLPATMESRKIPGLYFAGELLDVDAHTGGFNLQIAFSTGALAGYSAAVRGT